MLSRFLEVLTLPQSLDSSASPTFVTPVVSNVQFPAVQVASAGANVLDDYEENVWTPTFTFGTPGDLNVVYSIQVGRYIKIGKIVIATFVIVTSTFTHSTASGNAILNTLPFTSDNVTNLVTVGTLRWQGITKANYTQVYPRTSVNSTTIFLEASGSGQNIANITAADMPSAGTVDLRGTVIYQATA